MAIEIRVPDIGSTDKVDVIEVMISPGDNINLDDSLVTLESDKASMEIPATGAGKIVDVNVKVGDKVAEGDLILTLEGDAGTTVKAEPKHQETPNSQAVPATDTDTTPVVKNDSVYAGPAVRRLARELGIDLSQLQGSGHKNRIIKADIQAYVKQKMASGAGSGLAIVPVPAVDFSQFGDIDTQPLNKIKKLTGQYTHRAWVSIPHVTHFDEADITELEVFRKSQRTDVKLTPLAFIMKAVVSAMQQYPQFNASLDPSGESLILKKYFHIGIAVDTPNGLVVPVIRDVDTKGIVDLATEMAEISTKAREKGLTPKEMQGGCMTISSLGGIGGTAFTPIVNAPDVAILGVSRAKYQPVYQDNGQFIPRLIMPFSLSYDHRVIDGAEGARFAKAVGQALSDIRTLLL